MKILGRHQLCGCHGDLVSRGSGSTDFHQQDFNKSLYSVASSQVRCFWALAGYTENGEFTTELAKQLQIVIPSRKKAQPYFSF